MVKSATTFLCSECGWTGAKWYGRCPECGQWGTVDEFKQPRIRAGARTVARTGTKTAGSDSQSFAGQSYAGQSYAARSAGAILTDKEAQSLIIQANRTVNDIAGGNIGNNAENNADSNKNFEAAANAENVLNARIRTGFTEFDRILGGGLVPGSVVLIAGEPGIGKSTLLLETAANIARSSDITRQTDTAGSDTETGSDTAPRSGNNKESANDCAKVLYISGEESQNQVHMRASRIGALSDNLYIASTTDISTVAALIEHENPKLAVVDSVQTIINPESDGIPGGNSQVRDVAMTVIDIAKSMNIAVLLVGHVTKDGTVAGPRTLEHLVDVVCRFEGDSNTALRMLRSSKNRFGPTDEVGCFDMSGEGIEEITDPSGLFLSDSNSGETPAAGTCITFTQDGRRSLPIEIQALVTKSILPSPRRATSGVDANRLAMIIAVLFRHGGFSLINQDVYVSTIAGGAAKEPGCDLAIAAALVSAAANKPVGRHTIALGEISLTGQIRPVPRIANRLREAYRLGYTTAVIPRISGKNTSLDISNLKKSMPNMRIIETGTLREALSSLAAKQS